MLCMCVCVQLWRCTLIWPVFHKMLAFAVCLPFYLHVWKWTEHFITTKNRKCALFHMKHTHNQMRKMRSCRRNAHTTTKKTAHSPLVGRERAREASEQILMATIKFLMIPISFACILNGNACVDHSRFQYHFDTKPITKEIRITCALGSCCCCCSFIPLLFLPLVEPYFIYSLYASWIWCVVVFCVWKGNEREREGERKESKETW